MSITRETWTDDSGGGTDGTIIDNAALDAVYDSIENTWASNAYTPTWGNTGTANSVGNGTLTGTYFRIGALVHFAIVLNWGSTTSSGNGTWTFTLPLTATGDGVDGGVHVLLADATGPTYYPGATLTTSGTVFQLKTLASPYGNVTATAPFTWASGDYLRLAGWYWT